MRIVSIGYQGRTIDEFVEDLSTESVNVVVDVRETAQSRKSGFSKRQLEHRLQQAGIGYVHERGLGNPRDNREPFRSGDTTARERYRQLLFDSADVLNRIVDGLRNDTVALLCFERSNADCHRAIVAEEVTARLPETEVVTV